MPPSTPDSSPFLPRNRTRSSSSAFSSAARARWPSRAPLDERLELSRGGRPRGPCRAYALAILATAAKSPRDRDGDVREDLAVQRDLALVRPAMSFE